VTGACALTFVCQCGVVRFRASVASSARAVFGPLSPTPFPTGGGNLGAVLWKYSTDVLGGELPDRPLRGFVGQFELGQSELLVDVLKHHFDAFADGDVGLGFRVKLLVHQIGHQA
jgi:hypothetical protein